MHYTIDLIRIQIKILSGYGRKMTITIPNNTATEKLKLYITTSILLTVGNLLESKSSTTRLQGLNLLRLPISSRDTGLRLRRCPGNLGRVGNSIRSAFIPVSCWNVAIHI